MLLALLTAGCTSSPPSSMGDEGLIEPVEDLILYRAGEIVVEKDERFPPTNGTYFDIGTRTFEPTLGTTSDGTLFMAGVGQKVPGAPPLVGNGYSYVVRSKDHGVTWETVGPFVGPNERPRVPNSNDPYLYVDRWTDRIMKFDLQALACMNLETSDDKGATWSPPWPACGPPPVGLAVLHDHQSLVSAPYKGPLPLDAYPNVLVYCVNAGLTDLGSWCSSSFDGGRTWRQRVPGYPSGSEQCGGSHGHLRADDQGRIYRGQVGCQGPTVFRSDDGGLTWGQFLISGDRMLGHEVSIAIDNESNVYAVWIGEDWRPYLAVSTSQGAEWSVAIPAAPPTLGAIAHTHVAAGAPGRIAIGLVATEDEKSRGASARWNGYLALSLDALAADPLLALVRVNPTDDPLFIGPANACCGLVGDFIDTTIDPAGRPFVALAHNRLGHGIVGTLTIGPSLRSESEVLKP